MPDSPTSSLLARLVADPGRPRLTWYGDDGERVELSGAVLANWVTKTTNLLVEELDARPFFRVRFDLPGHWRSVVWALAVWRAGACVVVPGASAPAGGGRMVGERSEGTPAGDEPADAVLTASPAGDEPVDAVLTASPSPASGTVVAVALPALARAFPTPLPAGAVDGTAVLGYGDALGWVPSIDPAAPALAGPGGTTSHAALVPAGGSAGRMLLDATDAPLDTLLRRVLAALAGDGSVVLVGGTFAATLRADGGRRARLVASERITG